MSNFNENVYYLENDDFDGSGNFKHRLSKPMVVMLQSDGCGHCSAAKPEYQKFADMAPKLGVVVATIDIGSDRALNSRLSSFIPEFRGVPTFVAFKDGKYHRTHEGARTAQALAEFSKNL